LTKSAKEPTKKHLQQLDSRSECLEDPGNKTSLGRTDNLIGSRKQASHGKTYVIQKHNASHLHYDLRLEMEGVMKSWAVPKTPPINQGKKRLAVSVEDHPVDYAAFEGVIPESEYGAGTVEIWDNGTYKLLERTDRKIAIDIHGKKLQGIYYLIRLKEQKNWLFFKKKQKSDNYQE
jgi:DNA ligase D-like protein (predicted 3'-phosphoesterase)